MNYENAKGSLGLLSKPPAFYSFIKSTLARMKAKVADIIQSLTGINDKIEAAYHAGVVDGFDSQSISQVFGMAFETAMPMTSAAKLSQLVPGNSIHP